MDELDELAARGRANDARNEAARADAAEQRDVEDSAAAERERWRALSLWAMFTSDTRWIAALFLLVAPLLVASVLAMIALRLSDGVAKIALPIPPVVGTLAIMAYARVAARRAVERERRWLMSLPFTVTGYLECLGSYHRRNENWMWLTFEFDGELPATLKDILASDGGTWTVSGATATRRPGPQTRFREDHNRKVVRWFRQLVDQQLLPLHRKHPFRGVRVGNSERH